MRTKFWIKSVVLIVISGISVFAGNPDNLPKIETISSKNIYILEPRIEPNGEVLSLSGNVTSKPGDGLPSNPHLHIKSYNLEGNLISFSDVKINTTSLELNRKMPLHLDFYQVNIPTSTAKITIEIRSHHSSNQISS